MKYGRAALVVPAALASVAMSQTVVYDPPPAVRQPSGQPSPQVAIAQVLPSDAQGLPAVPPVDPYRAGGNSLMRAAAYAPPTPEPRAGQSRMEHVSLFAVPAPTPRTLKKHDLVTIIVREESSAKTKANTETSKESSLDAHIDQYLKLNKEFQLERANMAKGPLALQAGANREFTGEGQADRSDSFVTRIGAEVLDVKPNGTLVLQARKHIKLDEEEQEYVLSGVCRVEDVGADNTVLSTQLHDLDLAKTTKGAVRDASKRGLVTRFLDFLNPF